MFRPHLAQNRGGSVSKRHRNVCAGILIFAALSPACRETPSSPTNTGQSECNGAESSGWLAAVASHPDPQAQLGAAQGAWALLYRRRYFEALRAFEESEDPAAKIGAQRTQILLGRLYRRLGRFTASSLVRYFEERDALGSQVAALESRPFFEHVARRLAKLEPGPFAARAPLAPLDLSKRGRDRGLRRSYGRLIEAWPETCPKKWPAKLDLYGVIAHRIACGDVLTRPCPKVFGPRHRDVYGRRMRAYHRALCQTPSTKKLAELRRLAAAPATTEAIVRRIQLKPVKASFSYYDPIALFVLADFYLTRAQAGSTEGGQRSPLVAAWAALERRDRRALRTLVEDLSTPKADAGAFLMSEWRDAESLKSVLTQEPGSSKELTAEGLIEQFRAARRKHRKAIECGQTEAGRQVATELQLADGLAAAEVRRALPRLDDKRTCQIALPVLRATTDRRVVDRPSWLNEPGFLVQLAETAQCMGRSSEAIGALNAIESHYPEAEPARAAAESLAVVRLMGGSVGTQKTP